MPTCPSCGKELPGEFPFCPFCTAPLAAQPVSVQEERKVVSVLFCDLVGFTAASEAVDPEDVRARIRPYNARLRQVIEQYGGTVEKFVGDAVMAVFGAPVSHEDDAERAVRAGLRILEAIEELNAQDASLSLQVRVGVNTGEAVVSLGARPEEGEGFVTGDVVNTASRLQGVAPVNGVAVSEQTFRATGRVFDYAELEPVQVKGKAEPLSIYRPLQARARFGTDLTRTHATPLVGRELERQLLLGTFERSAQQKSCQLVTVVGEPGVGKSRLCAELFAHIEERPGLVTWRQGRCLPYGEGISFWALGEIVKAECGILESDSPEQAAAKLARTVPESEQDRAWLLARLAPLVGAPSEPATQEESFTAWRRFLEGLAGVAPAVLAFEDLHWADPALLAFTEYLADWAEGVPLLLLCTARPELHEQHPSWAGGLRNAHTINLAPLTDEETARLVADLLDRAVLPAETQQILLERAGGNPLYAEEFVRLLGDRGDLRAETAVPDSVQALIAARLDTLTSERKSLLQDASVLGKVFWAGALAEMGDRDPAEVEQALHELARKELVRPSRSSSMEEEAEYGFWHALVRDVAYGQIPRADRATRHQRAAAWIEHKAAERIEDLADVLAYHYQTAVELSQAAGKTGEAESLLEQALHYLGLAGERALGLDTDRAEQTLARALELCPADHPERARALERWAQAARQQGRWQEAKAAVKQALSLHRDRGDNLACGRGLTDLYAILARLGDPQQDEVLEEALGLLEVLPRGPELVELYARRAGSRYVKAHHREAIAGADQAIELASQLGLPPSADALGYRGGARAQLGEQHGVAEMQQALDLAVQQGHSRSAGVLYANLANVAWLYEGPQAAFDLGEAGVDFSRRRGLTESADFMAAGLTALLADAGKTEEALLQAESLAERLQEDGTTDFIEPRSVQLRLLVEQGNHHQAPDPQTLLTAARDSGQPQDLAMAVAAAARLQLARGNAEKALALLDELDQNADSRDDALYALLLPGLLRVTLACGNRTLAASLADGVQPKTPAHRHALRTSEAQLAEAAGRYSQAAALYAEAACRWQQFGNVPEHAYALQGQGRSLHALGSPEAELPLRQGRDLFAVLGYKPALAATETLLAPSEHRVS